MLNIKNPAIGELYEIFCQNPGELIAYIKKGIETNHCIIGTHLIQLALMYDLPLERKGVRYTSLPENFVSPSEFDNMGEFLARARFFAGSSVGRRRRFG